MILLALPQLQHNDKKLPRRASDKVELGQQNIIVGKLNLSLHNTTVTNLSLQNTIVGKLVEALHVP